MSIVPQPRTLFLGDYPPNLREMHRPPRQLYMRGAWSADYTQHPEQHRFLCVIGSRTPSAYGREAVSKLLSGLRDYPISIVSGLAIGIDSLAHEVALKNNLHCVAFPGSGLGDAVIYPSCKQPLAQKILASGGALLSEYPLDMTSQSWMFATRNRLMAALAHATLIIEGRRGSGTLMTANYVAEFNRDMLIVPGSIFSDLSYGPHLLFRRGATPICEANDILEALGFTPAPRQNLAESLLDKLSENDRAIINALRTGLLTREEISQQTKLPANILNIHLSALELSDLIKIDGLLIRLA